MKKQLSPIFLPEKSHGQRSLAGYCSPWGCKDADTTEQLSMLAQWRTVPESEN